PKLFLKKSISASNFEFTILFILKAIKKLPRISAIELINTDIILATNKINFGYYEKLFRHFGFGDDHLLREAISANIYNVDQEFLLFENVGPPSKTKEPKYHAD